jgi:hypothetical protein
MDSKTVTTESPLGPPPPQPKPAKPRARPNHKTIEMAYAQAEEWRERYERECARPLVDIVLARLFRAVKRW